MTHHLVLTRAVILVILESLVSEFTEVGGLMSLSPELKEVGGLTFIPNSMN